MKRLVRTTTILFLYGLCLFASFICLFRVLTDNERPTPAKQRESAWIATSKSWLDRTSCRWIGICGGTNWLGQTQWFYSQPAQGDESLHFSPHDLKNAWVDGQVESGNWSEAERQLRRIPKYVLDYAPYVFLHPDEPYWPSDPAEHLLHVDLRNERAKVRDRYPFLANLSELNPFNPQWDSVYLTSRDDPKSMPGWITSEYGRPDPYPAGEEPSVIVSLGEQDRTINDEAKSEDWLEVDVVELPLQKDSKSRNAGFSSRTTLSDEPGQSLDDLQGSKGRLIQDRAGGYSLAPAVLITIPKSNNVTDVYWYYFNSFNQGNKVIGIRFGNHIGDWEHCMVRFQNAAPKAVFTSRHSFGDAAYDFRAMERIGRRPIIYAARGSHAIYATAGTQPYMLPFGLLSDTTARGPLWDPLLNLRSYTYDAFNDILRASDLNPTASTSWFHFTGHWGDQVYPLGDLRQYRFAGEYHYSSGPSGPKDKNLKRRRVCQNEKRECPIKAWL